MTIELRNPSALDQIKLIYRDTLEEFHKSTRGEDEQYWQGRKDAMRVVLALLQSDEADNINTLLETSPGYIPTERAIFQELLKSAVYNAAAIVWELKVDGKADYRTLANLRSFVEGYEYMAQQGKVERITDHCLVRD